MNILKTDEVIERLGKIFCSPAYAFMEQVRNGTGYSRNTRTADAMYMSLWPSRGIYLAGIEVKVSRSDWLSELKDPKKADDLAKYCDYWYLALGDESIVKEGELPATWGLIVPYKKSMRIVKEATRLNPEPIDRLFLAAIMRNVTERTIPRAVIQSKLTEQYKMGEESGQRQAKSCVNEKRELEMAISAFEKASGVQINKWVSEETNRELGAAVKEVLTGRDKEAAKRLGKLKQRAQNILKYIEGQEVSSYDC